MCVARGFASPVWVGTGHPWMRTPPRGNTPEERWRHSPGGHICLQDVLRGGFALCRGCSPRCEGHQRPGGGKQPSGLSRHTDPMAPQQPRPRDNVAQPLITRCAQTKQLAQRVIKVGASSQDGKRASLLPVSVPPAARASPRPSHRYFHSLTSVLLPGGALCSKRNHNGSCISAKGWAVPHPSTTALAGHREELTNPSLAMRMPDLHRDPETGIPGREGCCQTDCRFTSEQLQTQRNGERKVQGKEPGKWLETKPRAMSQQSHPSPSSSPSGQEMEKVEGQVEGFLPLPCQAISQHAALPGVCSALPCPPPIPALARLLYPIPGWC